MRVIRFYRYRERIFCAQAAGFCLQRQVGFSQGSSAGSWCCCGVFYAQVAAIRVRKHLIVTPAREPLQSKGSPGLGWALLGSTGLFWARFALLGLSGLS